MAFDQTRKISVSSDDSAVLSIAASGAAEFSHLSGNATAHFVHLANSCMAVWLATRQISCRCLNGVLKGKLPWSRFLGRLLGI